LLIVYCSLSFAHAVPYAIEWELNREKRENDFHFYSNLASPLPFWRVGRRRRHGLKCSQYSSLYLRAEKNSKTT